MPTYRGTRVEYAIGDEIFQGTITSGNHRLRVKPDGRPNVRLSIHPTDDVLVYLTKPRSTP